MTKENHVISLSSKRWNSLAADNVFLVKLTNIHNVEIAITNYGASVQSIVVPDSNGTLEDVVLGYDDLEGYINDPFYSGAVVGRYANRIADASADIKGLSYKLAATPGGYHLHGGKSGFNKKIWKAEEMDEEMASITLSYVSVDMEEGFPGNLKVSVTYTLTDENELVVNYTAITDKPTIVNLTQHSYFNLNGYSSDTITDHLLKIYADEFLPVSDKMIPTGEYAPVINTPFDFLKLKKINDDITANNHQLKYGSGYDHTWVLKHANDNVLNKAGMLFEPESGRIMEVFTTEPGIHLYTGNFLANSVVGKANHAFKKRGALCLETQHFADSPNKPHFPNTILTPGEEFKSTTVFKFSTTSNNNR